ncbi:MAG: hypothetical protein AAGJ10_14900 [Bacteroidota bacterium]
MKNSIQAVSNATLAVSAPTATPRLVYSAPKLNIIGDLAKVSQVSLPKAFFFRTIT